MSYISVGHRTWRGVRVSGGKFQLAVIDSSFVYCALRAQQYCYVITLMIAMSNVVDATSAGFNFKQNIQIILKIFKRQEYRTIMPLEYIVRIRMRLNIRWWIFEDLLVLPC